VISLARELAGFVVRERFGDLPSKSIDYAEMLIASTSAVPRWVRQSSRRSALQDKINDANIGKLIDKVRMVDPPTQNLERFQSGAIVTIQTSDGRSHSATVYTPKGSAALGIAWCDVEAKYSALVPHARPAPENLEASLRVIGNFRRVRNASELVDLLR
jgi:2-methylcitrate dehydratase PrpD